MAEAASLAALASRFIDTEQVPWIETAPGNKMKVIYHDPASGMLTILSKLEPGSGIPAHVHEGPGADFCARRLAGRRRRRMHRRQFRHPRQGQPPCAEGAKRLHRAHVFAGTNEGLKKALLKHA